MEWLKTNWVDVVTVITYIVTAASIITKFTKNTYDDKMIGKLLNFLALIPRKNV